MKNTTERVTGRLGVLAAQLFFERNGCVFQEVAQQNDFGKDGYVDIGESGFVTCLCAALQVKSGTSFRNARGDYFIPLDDHAETWRHSTVPVFGLVYDPDDDLLRWVDLTRYLRAHPGKNTGSVPVPRAKILTAQSLHGEFKMALTDHVDSGLGPLTLNLLAFGKVQTDAVYDAWALGRFDPKYFLILRRLLLDLRSDALVRAIILLSHAGSHPDIFWTKDNWVPQRIQNAILPSFRWSSEEIIHMVQAIEPEDWGRGTAGQCLDVLLYEDPNLIPKLRIAIAMLLEQPDEDAAVRVAAIDLSHSRDKRKELNLLREQFPDLTKIEWFQGIAAHVQMWNDFSMY